VSGRSGKAAARALALEQRRAAHAAGAPGAGRLAAGHALEVIAGLRGVAVVAAYLPIRDEIDPVPAMLALSGLGYAIAVPVIEGRGRPLVFRRWTQGSATVPGLFGVPVPADGERLEPDALIVPMLAFDRRGHRLGYGGGFYDRTIAELRARREVAAVGFAYADQEMPEVPDSEHDMRLDAVVTEAGVIRPG
jgi:5-formyltetrahydrofolate cyclo-ligase